MQLKTANIGPTIMQQIVPTSAHLIVPFQCLINKTNHVKAILGVHSAYILHTRAFGTYLLGGYLPCKKIIMCGIFQNIHKCLYFNTPY